MLKNSDCEEQYFRGNAMYLASLKEPKHQQALLARFDRLTPQHQGLWGKMTVDQMICHISDQLRIALGEIPTKPTNTILANGLVKKLAIYVIPWAKGKHQAAPEMLNFRPINWQTDLTNFKSTVDRFVARDINGPWSPHPLFGSLSGRDWGVLAHRHIDHHLRQFGV
jgi:hypothetical protein